MRYVVTMTNQTKSGPYVAWLAKRGSGFPLTAHPSNARWFKTKNIPKEIVRQILQAFGNVQVGTMSEEELDAWMVMKAICESTYSLEASRRDMS